MPTNRAKYADIRAGVDNQTGFENGVQKSNNSFLLRLILFPVRTLPRLILSLSVVTLTGFYLFNGNTLVFDNRDGVEKQLADVIAAVSKLMVIPEDDKPVLATVTDAEELKRQQQFFARAENGDQLLLFPKTLQAVMYRPKINKIINVGPVHYESQPGLSEQSGFSNSDVEKSEKTE